MWCFSIVNYTADQIGLGSGHVRMIRAVWPAGWLNQLPKRSDVVLPPRGASPQIGDQIGLRYVLKAFVREREVIVEDNTKGKAKDFRFGVGQLLPGMDEAWKKDEKICPSLW